MRILSGIQPSGTLHLGDYFGAIQHCVELQETAGGTAFCSDGGSRLNDADVWVVNEPPVGRASRRRRWTGTCG
jgi:tryptophanyl-tRNA synthetase